MARNLSFPPSVKPGIPKLGKKPDGWSRVSFGSVLDVVQKPAELVDGTEYQLVVAKRNRGGVAPRERLKGREILTKSQFFVHTGDFLISKRQIVHGACGIVPAELDGAVVSNEYSVLHGRNGLSLDYLEYYTHAVHFQQTCFHASVGVAVEKMIFRLDEWLKHPFYLPPPREQVRIVEILKTWDRAIKHTEKLIAAKRQLKQGLMEQLLTGRRRFPEFAGQPWPARCLSDIGSFAKGKGFGKSDLVEGDGVPGILYGELYTTYEIAVRRVRSRVLTETATKSTPIRRNDILFPSSGETADEIAKPAVYLGPKGAVAGGDVIIFRPQEGDPLFLSFALNSQEAFHYRSRVAQGQSIVHIYRDNLAKHPVPFPSVPEQKQIASALDCIAKEIALLEQQRNLMVTEKRGLMQKLLTGEIRVGGRAHA